MKLSVALKGLVLLLTAAGTPQVASYTNPIVIKDYKMYDAKTGKYFGVRGVDYYPRANTGVKYDVNNYDFFTDDHESIWGPDINHLAEVGANAVRLYAVNPTLSHDKFMCALRAKGMYALVDFGANCEGCAITKDAYPACYPSDLKTRGEMIITAFAKYDNVLAFSAGNEVNHVVTKPEENAPCQKKFLRDMRQFIGTCSSIRDIPVGVVLADTNREENALYYNCRTDSSDKYENAEWYGLNVYQYCDAKVTDVAKSGGFQTLLSDFKSYKMNIPVLLTEFGCLNPSFPTVEGYDAQRTWLQAGWLHNKDFRTQFNGGFVFEYSTENANSKADSAWPFTKYGAQNYGLGYFSPEDCDHDKVPCTYNRMPNYDSLAEQYNKTSYSDEPDMGKLTVDTDKTAFPSCPAGFSKLSASTWAADKTVSLACPEKAQAYTCPGQTSSGSWTSDAGSTSTDKPAPTPTPSTGSGSGGSSPSPTPKPNGSPSPLGPLTSACVVAAIAAMII